MVTIYLILHKDIFVRKIFTKSLNEGWGEKKKEGDNKNTLVLLQFNYFCITNNNKNSL